MRKPVIPPSAPPPPSPPPTAKGRWASCANAAAVAKSKAARARKELRYGFRHGQAMIAVLAILNPKLAPGERLVKKDSDSFVLSASSSGLGLATEAEQPAGALMSVIGALSSYSKSMKYSGSATRRVRNLQGLVGSFRGTVDVELDEVVGPLLHPVVGHRAEIDRSCRRS